MDNKEAIYAIKILKSGRSYKDGHYQHGYTYISYDKINNNFNYKIEHFGLDIYNPDISEKTLNEKELMLLLINNFSLDNFEQKTF